MEGNGYGHLTKQKLPYHFSSAQTLDTNPIQQGRCSRKSNKRVNLHFCGHVLCCINQINNTHLIKEGVSGTYIIQIGKNKQSAQPSLALSLCFLCLPAVCSAASFLMAIITGRDFTLPQTNFCSGHFSTPFPSIFKVQHKLANRA